jgi:N-acetylmuramoyl-L-alanine amidase
MLGIKPLPILSSRVLVTLLVSYCFFGLLFLPSLHCQAAIIVLDPGHGGNDNGAGSGSAFTEKQFTLALAEKIAALLEANHRVELTRTSDIQMMPEDRAAVANHLQADLMISLHAAVAPYCSDRDAAVYYHSDEHLTLPFGASLQGMPVESDADRPAWVKLQVQHQHQSRSLAIRLKQSMGDSDSFDGVTVSGVPLVTLMGADLPAVLVEVGCILPAAASNAQQFELLLNGYAASIADAIETALPGLAR